MTPAPSPLDDVIRRAKAFAHPVRARTLAMLREGPLCVSQLTAVLELAASTVSAHLSTLRRSGLITEEKHGKWVRYRLTEDAELNYRLQQVFSLFECDPCAVRDAKIVRALRRVPVETLCRAGLDLETAGVVSAAPAPRATIRKTVCNSRRPLRMRSTRVPG